MDHYWATINLTGRESKKYTKIARELSTADMYLDDPLYTKVIQSPRYSFDFKRKLALHLTGLKQAQTWGYQHFTGEDLYQLIKVRTFHVMYEFDLHQIQLLVANPSFVSSFGRKFDSLSEFLNADNDKPDKKHYKDQVVAELIKSDQMTLRIAEHVLTINNRTKKHLRIIEMPIIQWAKDRYGLIDVPDSWVVNFISSQK